MTEDEVSFLIADLTAVGKNTAGLGSQATGLMNKAALALMEARAREAALKRENADLESALEEGQAVWAEARKKRVPSFQDGGIVVGGVVDNKITINGYGPMTAEALSQIDYLGRMRKLGR